MFPKTKFLALCIALAAAPTTLAQNYVVNVHGIVCEFCSLGVTKKVSKLPFIDRSQFTKGVKVDIENQLVTIAVLDSALLDTNKLFKAIESGGYNPIDIHEVRPNGELAKVQP